MASICSHVVIGILVLFIIFYSAESNTNSKLIQLNEENWSQMLEGEWMVEFFAPWCPACKALEKTWSDFADWSKDLDIKVAQVDVTTNPGLSGRFMVTALPTIFHVLNGQFRQYRGSRDKESFIGFIEEKKWQNVEEVPGWKTPNSIQMSLISQFFKMSMVLRSIHTKLIEEYGIPYWGSYLIFALATILIGAILGLLLVCIIDFVFPPKSALPPTQKSDSSFPASTNEEKSEDDDDARSLESNKDQVANSTDNNSDLVDDDIQSEASSSATDDLRKRKTTRKDE